MRKYSLNSCHGTESEVDPKVNEYTFRGHNSAIFIFAYHLNGFQHLIDFPLITSSSF